MITNTRLLELRATALACQKKVEQDPRNATHLEKDFIEFYELAKSEFRGAEGFGVSLNFLYGK